jgi:hypothetical protein
MVKAKLIVLLVFLFIFKGFTQSSDWKFIKKVDGISIYHRNSGIGNLKDVKIETTFDCNLSTVTEALLDVSAFTKWIYKVEYAKILKVHKPNQIEFYEKIKLWNESNNFIKSNTTQKNIIEIFCEKVNFKFYFPLNKNDYITVDSDYEIPWIDVLNIKIIEKNYDIIKILDIIKKQIEKNDNYEKKNNFGLLKLKDKINRLGYSNSILEWWNTSFCS